MRVSMNGFRRNLTNEVNRLRDLVKDAINGEFMDNEDFADAFNEVICQVNTLNCIYSNDDPDFTDMSDLEVVLLEYEGGRAA